MALPGLPAALLQTFMVGKGRECPSPWARTAALCSAPPAHSTKALLPALMPPEQIQQFHKLSK